MCNQDLTVDPRNRTRSSVDQRYMVSGHGAPSSDSGPAQIAHALKTGSFSLGGTTTLDGQRAVKIRLPQVAAA
jgi:hypothetical protein